MNILFLDVDGVINSFSDRPPKKNSGWFGEWRTEKVDGIRVMWSVELIERLNTLGHHPDVQIVWATDWRLSASETLAGVIGADSAHWGLLDPSDALLEDTRRWWKHDFIREYIEKHEPTRSVWVDDNIHNAKNARYWLQERGQNFLAIPTNGYHGLTQRQMALIEAYLPN